VMLRPASRRRGSPRGDELLVVFCSLGILVAGVGTQDCRWGLQGEGLRLPGEVGEV
jgi:hypothetical protein